MSDRTIVLGTIAACMLAMPVAAQAPAPTTPAFDGTYVGVSRTSWQGSMDDINEARFCPPNGQPGPLTIAGGAARWLSHTGRTFEGSVNARGALVMHGPYGNRIDAQLDSRGTVTGRMSSFCSYQLVWRKEGK